MTASGNTSRRGFLGNALRGVVLWAGCWLYGLPVPARPIPALEPAETSLLRALIDTLIPEDGYPGALQAGVPARINTLLAASPRRMTVYRRGLAAIMRKQREAADGPFVDLPPARRSELLEAYWSGVGPAWIFLEILRRDVMTAFYSSPAAYAMLGYAPPLNGYPYEPAAPNGGGEAGD